MARPRVGVFKFASCDGCQLSLLDCEDELLDVAAAIDIAYFPEARRQDLSGDFDVALVEGSVSVPSQVEEIFEIRRRSKLMVAIGACATSGGIQALRNLSDCREFIRAVYAKPDYIRTLATSTPLSAHVTIDYELRGCPISKAQLLELISALLKGRRPQVPDEAVCTECKRAGVTCVAVAQGASCLGPVTHAGCGAICPRFDRACYGCFGPRENANTASLMARYRAGGRSGQELALLFEKFNNWAKPFRDEAVRQRGGGS